MADILIKNMKMPKSCEDCWMTYEGDSDNCPLVNESVVKYMVEERRHPSCPLVEFPLNEGKCCGNCKWCHEGHYEEEGEQPYVKRKCSNKYGLNPNYSVYEHDYCSRWEGGK